MFLIFSIVNGSVILPSPSWIGYAPQLRFLGKPYHVLPSRKENGYKIDPADLDALFRSLVAGQHILLLNNPHNPTGAVYSRKELQAIADVCRSDGSLVLADEIYALITCDRESFVSMGTIFPDGTFVTGDYPRTVLPPGTGSGPASCHRNVQKRWLQILPSLPRPFILTLQRRSSTPPSPPTLQTL